MRDWLLPLRKILIFSIYDSTYPFISWKISGQNNAYGPTPCEPRSGEIIACHIGIFLQCLEFGTEMVFCSMWSE